MVYLAKHARFWSVRTGFDSWPPSWYDQLMREIAETSWSAVGRKYGVSDNAVRKWVRWYEAEVGAT